MTFDLSTTTDDHHRQGSGAVSLADVHKHEIVWPSSRHRPFNDDTMITYESTNQHTEQQTKIINWLTASHILPTASHERLSPSFVIAVIAGGFAVLHRSVLAIVCLLTPAGLDLWLNGFELLIFMVQNVYLSECGVLVNSLIFMKKISDLHEDQKAMNQSWALCKHPAPDQPSPEVMLKHV